MEALSLRLLMDMKRVEPLSLPWLAIFAELTNALRLEVADASLLNLRIAVTTKDGNFFTDLYPFQSYAHLK